jgi:hypothetical protein
MQCDLSTRALRADQTRQASAENARDNTVLGRSILVANDAARSELVNPANERREIREERNALQIHLLAWKPER